MQNQAGHRPQPRIILTGESASALGPQIPLEGADC